MISQKEIHENAVNKGFWDPPSSFGKLTGLLHSEITEIFEEYRDGRDIHEIYYDKLDLSITKKPLGIPVEIADLAIRLLDLAGYYNFNLEEAVYTTDLDKDFINVLSDDFATVIVSLHGYLPFINCAGTTKFENDPEGYKEHLEDVAFMINYICEKFKIGLNTAIELKHAYNLTRIFKHGKQF